jgi:hypothetical protein
VAIICIFALPMLRDAKAASQMNVCGMDKISVFFATSAGALFLVGIVVLGTWLARAMIAKLPLLRLETRAWLMPRMMFGSGITLVILIGAGLNVSVFLLMYLTSFFPNSALLVMVSRLLGFGGGDGMELVQWVNEQQGVLFAASSVVAAGLGLLMAGGFTSAIHIARDLIDHQYRPQLGYAHYLPGATGAGPERPRRQRIAERLDTLARELTCKDGFDDLVFVVHSQGSVIVYDYLLAGGGTCAELLSARPHLVTFGSPLTHLYQFYFKDYDELGRSIGALKPQLASWTNLYRVDDYVGRQIDDGEGGFVENKVLAAGGHMNYWSERALAEVVLARIRQPARTAA